MPAQADGISPENLEKIRQIKLRQWIDGKELLDGGIEVYPSPPYSFRM